LVAVCWHRLVGQRQARPSTTFAGSPRRPSRECDGHHRRRMGPRRGESINKLFQSILLYLCCYKSINDQKGACKKVQNLWFLPSFFSKLDEFSYTKAHSIAPSFSLAICWHQISWNWEFKWLLVTDSFLLDDNPVLTSSKIINAHVG
jgi:hypothetical protein